MPTGAPLEVTADLINTFNISLVVRGSVSETPRANDRLRYAVPKQMGIFRCVRAPGMACYPPSCARQLCTACIWAVYMQLGTQKSDLLVASSASRRLYMVALCWGDHYVRSVRRS